MNIGFIIAIISPFIFGFMNVFDKYLVSHRVKNPLGFTAVTGIAAAVIGFLIAVFVKWDIHILDLVFPILAGICSGVAYYFYFFVMKRSDASYVVGFLYMYPIVVAVLSFVFLKERLPPLAYFAMVLILTGVILLSVRAKKIKLALLIGPLLIYICILGFYEFFIKVATYDVSFMQGLAITTMVSGLTIMGGLLNSKVRTGFVNELKNIKWAFLSEFITVFAVLTLYFAMTKFDATIVASIASIQPLALLIFERIAHAKFGKITQDELLLPKLLAIILIVIGVGLFALLSA